jgi:DNA repair exonuclease SbcCD ATPase subunit
MLVITQARQKLQAAARAAESPFSTLESSAARLSAELNGVVADATVRHTACLVRFKAFEASLEQELSHTRALLGPGSSSMPAFQALQATTSAGARGFAATAGALDVLVSGLDELLTRLRDGIAQALGLLSSARAALRDAEGRALAALDQLDRALESVKRSLRDQLDQLEALIVGTIEQIRSACQLFIATVRSTLQGFKAIIAGATAPALAGADLLSQLVTDLQTRADSLIQQIESVVASVTGAIDQIPVSALPEPLAQPAVTAVQQVSSQFATQLEAGAKAAGSVLQTLSGQISSAIQSGQQTLSTQLDAAFTPLFGQIDTLVQQITAKREEVEAQLEAKLSELVAQKSKLLGAARQQIDALTAPALAALDTACTELEQAATQAAGSVSQAIDAGTEQLANLRREALQVADQCSALGASVEAAQAESAQAFARLRALAVGTPGQVP